MHGWRLHDRIRPYVICVGLYGASRVSTMNTDHDLVTVVVERWLQETHTFHLLVDEALICSRTPPFFSGCGLAVELALAADLWATYDELLGLTPNARALKGIGLWFQSRDSSQCNRRSRATYARAYILKLLGTILFVDIRGSGSLFLYLLVCNFEEAGSFSSGNTALACLYLELCCATLPINNQIVVCLLSCMYDSFSYILTYTFVNNICFKNQTVHFFYRR